MSRPVRPPIRSEFSDEPEMRELIEQFAGEMPGRVVAIRRAWEGGKTEALRRLAHQLKGAAGGYGFSVVGDTAAELEDQLCAEEPALDEVRALVASLVDLCERVKAG
jgi:HPt (histidine-containing phosphotransfer) domain-containing protein